MLQSGRVVFGQMEEVLFGRPAAEAVAEESRRLDARRVFLMVSGALNHQTDKIEKYGGSLAIIATESSTRCRLIRRGVPS
jgi:hypothetical protein